MARDTSVLLDGLGRYLRHSGRRVSAVTPLSTGHSNETYLLEGAGLVLRTPPSQVGLLPPYDMGRQFEVFAELARTPGAPPVPAVHSLCRDRSLIGDEFYVMEQAYGQAFEYDVPPWLAGGAPEVRSGVCRQWVGAVCALHLLSPLESLGAPRTPGQEAERWRDRAEAVGAAALAGALDTLVRNPPPTSGPPTPTWGDPKLANVLWDDTGQLVAVVDFELALNGEPLSDLGYVLFLFPEDPALPRQPGFDLDGMWARGRVIAEWEGRTGRSARGVELHEAAQLAKIGTIMAIGGDLYQRGLSTDERMAEWSAVPDAIVPYVEERIDRGLERLGTARRRE